MSRPLSGNGASAIPPDSAISRKWSKVRLFRRWIRRLRFIFGAMVLLIGIYVVVSYRIHTLPGDREAGIPSPIDGIGHGDTLLLQNLNLWRSPKLGDVVVYTNPQLGDDAPELLIGRVAGLPGETINRDGPFITAGGRKPFSVGFDIDPDSPLQPGQVIPEGSYLLLADNDAVAYLDSRNLGFIEGELITRRVSLNFSHFSGSGSGRDSAAR